MYSIESFKAKSITENHISIEYNDNISINITFKPFKLTVLNTSTSMKLLTLNTHSMLSIDINSVDFTYYSNYSNPVRSIGLPARDSHVFFNTNDR